MTAIKEMTTTTNGAAAYASTTDAVLDLFYQIGSLRQGDPIPYFEKAYKENQDLALRTLLWARDIRGGAGERETFRKILLWLESQGEYETLEKVIPIVPIYGRWDDLLIFLTDQMKEKAFDRIAEGLENPEEQGLCAKWLPRKGIKAVELRSYLGLSPRKYRNKIVNLTDVVEQQMCGNDWPNIQYKSVPSVAMARYKRAFSRHDAIRFVEYLNNVQAGKTTINASSVFPYDILRPVISENYYSWKQPELSDAEIQGIVTQWDNLPNNMTEAKMLPLVDCSGSMVTDVAGNITAMDVAISLGLYVADKNEGAFKDKVLNFSSTPKFFDLENKNIVEKATVLKGDQAWGGSTNINAALEQILFVATAFNVPQEDMPEYLVIFSDMQFDAGVKGKTIHDKMRQDFEDAGYKLPTVIYWNLNGKAGNTPVTADENGTVLVSGFSPAIMTNILNASSLDPVSIMLDTLMDSRYNLA